MEQRTTFDPIWQGIYQQGRHLNRYPWDVVVSFVYRHAPKDRDRSEIRILEVGCGAGNNLWFASREGFDVTGVDASDAVIEVARRRFREEGLSGDFRVADFTSLPLESNNFDLVIDRAAITNCGFITGAQAINEVRRVLNPGGFFLFNPYAVGDSSQKTGRPGPDGVVLDISEEGLAGVGQICFYSEDDIRRAFADGWRLVSMQQMVMTDKLKDRDTLQSDWRVIAEKL